jgi:hypothetical protein
MPDQLVITPGGYRPQSMVHLFETGSVVDCSGGRLRKVDRVGRVLTDYGAVETTISDRPLMPDSVVTLRRALELHLGEPAPGERKFSGASQSCGQLFSIVTESRIPVAEGLLEISVENFCSSL